MSIKRQTVKKAMKKMTTRKKVVNLKTGYMVLDKDFFRGTLVKEHPNHAINSYLAHGGDDKSLKNMVIVKMEVIGKPIVKTTREITIKK